MHIAYDYMPSIHRMAELPAGKFLRRELGLPNVVTYFHTIHECWVVSLKDGPQMMDIGKLGDGDGKDQSMTKENADSIIRRMKTLITRAEAKRRLNAHAKDQLRECEAKQDRHLEGHRRVQREIKKKHGPQKAGEYAQIITGTEEFRGFDNGVQW